MLTTMTEGDWTIVLKVFEASCSRRGDKGRDDRKFLEALQYFVVHNITWRALPEKFGHWNSVWKRFWRLSRSGTFEAFFDALAALSETAHLVQMFDSTVVRVGNGSLKNFRYTTLKRSKSPMFNRCTVDFTASLSVNPAACSTRSTFFSVTSVCSSMVVPMIFAVFGSNGPCPETKTKSPQTIPELYGLFGGF